MKEIGTLLIVFGVVIVAAGVLLLLLDKIPFIGDLPGDIKMRKGDKHFFFPITTCIVLSIVLTLMINLLLRLFQK